MKNKDLKEYLKNKADKTEIKDVSNKVLQSVHHTPDFEPAKKQRNVIYKKYVYPVLTCAACIVLIIFAFSQFHGKIPDVLEVSKAEIVFSKEIVAIGNAFSEMENIDNHLVACNKKPQIIPLANTFSNTELKKIAEKLNIYLEKGKAYIADSQIELDYKKNEDIAYSNYDYKLTVKYSYTETENKIYTVYYNEKFSKKSNETEIQGVAVINGKDLALEGKQKDDGEEVEMKISIKTGDKSYIEITNEKEFIESEYEYEYKIVENDVVVKRVETEISLEDGIYSAEFEITENTLTEAYEFVYEKDYVIAVYENDDFESEVQIITKDGQKTFIFEDGTEIII